MLVGTVVFLSLVVIVLAMPVTLTYQLSWKQTLSASVRLNWAFGLVRTNISPDPKKPRSEEPQAARKKARRRRRLKARKTDFMAAIRQPAFRRRMFRLISDVWRAIHKKNVELRVRMGLGDPAGTGQLWAVLGPVSGMVSRLRDMRISIEPDFLDSTLEVDSSGTVRMIPLQFAIIALGVLASPAVWRGILSMRSSG